MEAINKNIPIEVTFATSNQNKINEFKLLLGTRLDSKFIFNFQKVPDLSEIQGTCKEVAIDKCLKAYQYLQKPCLVDDESFLIESLGGFPGPYLKDFESALLADGIYEILKKMGDKCFTKTIYAITFDGKEVITFEGMTECGSIEPRKEFEKSKNYWESIYVKESGKRFEEHSLDDLNNNFYMRKKALDDFVIYFN